MNPNPINPFFESPDPKCEKECRFGEGISSTTAMYFPPVYDKHGNNLNPDGNITSSMISCGVCGRRWNRSSSYGNTNFTEIK
jgi:hypothetical protein